MKYNQHKKGYSLVEVLIAISVLMISIVGPLTIASKGLKTSSLSQKQNTAFFLAEEGIEGVVKIREENALQYYISSTASPWNNVQDLSSFNCVESNPCGIDVENDMEIFSCSDRTCGLYLHENSDHIRYQHVETSDAPLFQREIFIDVDSTRVRVKSVVTWGDSVDKKVELESYLYNIYENQ